ncbi:MAG: FmdE family protein [Clostridia bacterium]
MIRKLWDKALAFHGHECPGLAIGARACEAAMEKMGIGLSDDEGIVCVTENDACGVDAVQAIFSCTIGKGNLLYRGTGKQAFSFFNRKNGEKMRVYLKAQKKPDMERAEWQAYLLNAPVDEIFSFSELKYELPEKARIFQTVICEMCGEGAPEHKIRLQDGKKVCLDCFKAYDRGW